MVNEKKEKKPDGKKSLVEKEMNEPTIAVTSCEATKYQSVDKTNEVSKHRVLVSTKKMEKILKTEKVAYLAVFMPNQNQHVGVAVFGGGPVRQFALDQAAVATHTARDDVTADIPRGTSLWLGVFGKSSL